MTDVAASIVGAGLPPFDTWGGIPRCIDADPETFFPEKGGSVAEAKALCAICPAVDDCRQWALDNDERFGVWGGLSENDRRRLRGRREAA